MYHAAALHHVAMGSLHLGIVGHLKSRFSVSQFWQQARDDGATFAVLMGSLSRDAAEPRTPNTDHRVKRRSAKRPRRIGLGSRRPSDVRVLWQTYGMTEIYAAPMTSHATDSDPATAVGSPAAWTDFGILDDNGDLLPAGEIGEIVFRPRIHRG